MALSTDNTFHAAAGTTDGVVVGRNSTSKVGFYGTTPVVRNAAPFSLSTGTTAQLAAILAAYGLIVTTA